jgi:subfamily B ATP-binding cassette protein MsbA
MKSLLRLKPYLRPHLKLIVASALLAIPLAALRLGPAPLAKYFVDRLMIQKDSRWLLTFPLVVIALYSLNFIVRFGHYYLLRVVIGRINLKIKNDLFEHLLSLSADYFTAQSNGTLIARTKDDPSWIDGGLASINVAVREPITLIFIFAYAVTLNWRLTLITLFLIPPLAWLFRVTGRNLKRYISKMTDENAQLTSALQESFAGIRVIKLFRLENYVRTRFQRRSHNYARFYLKTAALEEASHPLVELFTAFALAAVFYYGGVEIIAGRMTGGDFLGFFVAFAMMMNPIRMLNDINIKLNQASAACDRVFEVFDWTSRLKEPLHPIKGGTFSHSIELRDISFAYPDAPERSILKGVSFEIKKGQVVALVGASGAGKSSLASLLPRIFDVTSGQILVDGVALPELDLALWRRQIAVVSQDVFLFNDTIEENIRCGRLGATPAEIREAAQAANAAAFIESLPQGYQTMIGDRGQKLSGGERQRISIARAFLRQAPLLILDEATSSLDPVSERAVQDALDALIKERTSLIIAHRLSTIQHADLILVMRDGQIIERGTHTQLLEKNSEYARLYQVGSELRGTERRENTTGGLGA